MKYEVVFETTAILDLCGIFDYITDILKEPKTARRVFFSIEKKVMSKEEIPTEFPCLDDLPKCHGVVRDEPYASIGVRFMPVGNYTVFYIADETERKVHVLRILYNRREWQNLLI